MPPENPNFIRFSPNGSCVIRFVTPLFCFGKHFLHTGVNMSWRPINNCPGMPTCPLCEQGNRCFPKYAAYCIDHADGQFKVFEFGEQLNQLLENAYDHGGPQLGDPLADFNYWTISKRGNDAQIRYMATHGFIPGDNRFTPNQLIEIRLFWGYLDGIYPQLDRQDVLDIMEGRPTRPRAVTLPPKKKTEEDKYSRAIVVIQKTRWEALEI